MKKDSNKNKKNDNKDENKTSDFYKLNVSIFLIFLLFTCIYSISLNTSNIVKPSQDYSLPNHLRVNHD